MVEKMVALKVEKKVGLMVCSSVGATVVD